MSLIFALGECEQGCSPPRAEASDRGSASLGAPVPFTLDRGTAEAGRPYRLLASAAGNVPGTLFGSLLVPLNEDAYLRWSLTAGPPRFEGASGVLDAVGRASATLDATGALLAPIVGRTLEFCAVLGHGPDEHSPVVGVEALP